MLHLTLIFALALVLNEWCQTRGALEYAREVKAFTLGGQLKPIQVAHLARVYSSVCRICSLNIVFLLLNDFFEGQILRF